MQLAPSVAQSLSSDYISTQTAAFGLIAMAQLAERIGSGNIQADWSLNGRQMEPVNTPKAIHQVDIAGNPSLGRSHQQGRRAAICSAIGTYASRPTRSWAEARALRLSVRYVDLNGNPLTWSRSRDGVLGDRHRPEQRGAGVHRLGADAGLSLRVGDLQRAMPEDAASASNVATLPRYQDDRVLTYFNLAAGQSKIFRVRLQRLTRQVLPPAVSARMYAEEEARNSGAWSPSREEV